MLENSCTAKQARHRSLANLPILVAAGSHKWPLLDGIWGLGFG
jgi:hypothetical protein